MLSIIRVNEIAKVYRLTHQTRTSYKRDWGACALTIKKTGRTVYETHGGAYITDKSHILLLRKGLSCVIHPDIGECITIEFEGYVPDNFPDVTSFEITNKFDSITILDRMEKEWTAKTVSSRYACMSGFYQVLSLLERENYPAVFVPAKYQIQPALDYIEEHYGDPDLGNTDLAKSVNLSVSRFRQVFRNALNKSPMQYLRSLRIGKAKDLLAFKGKTVTEVSEIVGYSSPFYFDVVFRKEAGMTPTHYLQNFRDSQNRTATFSPCSGTGKQDNTSPRT